MVANLPDSAFRSAECSTFVDLLQARAIHQSDQEGYCFLIDGEQAEVKLSYGTLNQQAQAIAARLQSLNLRGERALLIYPAGLDLIAAFFGCLYAGMIAVPVYPPRRNLASIQAIATDAQASAVLTLQSLLAPMEPLTGIRHRIATDKLLQQPPDEWQPVALDPDAPAFLQYTSGSTGQPKGVIVSHANLRHNSALIYEKFGHSAASRGVIWLPPYHDMGLIGGILQPLYGGFPVTLMAPVAFLQKPIRWLAAISRYGAHHAITSGGPNFAYDRCADQITPDQKADLDLSGWTVAFTGAEPIRAATLSRFAAAFADCGFRPEAFYPCYGLAEATLFVTGGNMRAMPQQLAVSTAALQQHRVEMASDSEAVQTLVSCGQPAADQAIRIVDPDTRQLCPPDRIGEIWLAGESVAQGYWNQPQLSAQTFARLPSETDRSTYLRTGDLGFIYNNELFVTGRIKDVLIIRGRNYYPQDIERTVERSHPALSPGCGGAFTSEIEGTEQLVVVQEVNREHWRSIDVEEITRVIRAAISKEHQLQVHQILLLRPGTIPKTSSGKVKRYACRKAFEDGELTAIKQSQTWKRNDISNNINNPISLSASNSFPNLPNLANFPSPPASDRAPSSSRADALIEWLRDYATHHINSRLIDERRCIPPAIVLDFGNQGLLGMQVAKQYGGLGLGHIDTMRVLQQLGAIDPTLALFVGLNNVLGIRPIAQSASPALREQLLPRLATGRELAAFALTEPGAGANPQSIAAVATPDGTGWRLNGTKIWSGSAAWAGVITVFVQDRQHQGISGFVLQRGNPGLRQGPEALTMGMRGMVQNTLYLENAPVTADQRLGMAGTGMAIAQDAMMYGRLAIAAASVGGMKRCAQLMLRYSARRSVATGKLLEHPVVLMRLHHLNAAIVATETLVTQIAQRLDAGETLPIEAYTACKTAAPEFYWQAADGLVQTLGGRGYIETNLAPQILRDARVLRIFEGPTETLNAFLGSRVLHQHQPLQQWLSQTLNAPEISRRLLDAAAQINERCCDIGFGTLTAQRWAAVWIGEVATMAILWASLQNAYGNAPNPKLGMSLEWIESQFQHKLAQAIVTISDQSRSCTTTTIANQVVEYEQTVGDIEQTLAGEDQDLDALLRKTLAPQASPLPEPVPPPSVALEEPSDTHQSDAALTIQDWIIQWLSHKLELVPEHIDRHRSFADYGIDSVIAVELAQDLETWLKLSKPLDATVAWNFPSIATLSRHLASLSSTPADSSPLPSIPPTPQSLNESDLAVLLAAELAAAKRRRRR